MAEAAPNTGKVSANGQDYEYSVTVGTDGDNKDQPQTITINGTEYTVKTENGQTTYTNASGTKIEDPEVKGVLDKSLADWKKNHPQQPAAPKTEAEITTQGEHVNGDVTTPDVLTIKKDGHTYVQQYDEKGQPKGPLTVDGKEVKDGELEAAQKVISDGLTKYQEGHKPDAEAQSEVTNAQAIAKNTPNLPTAARRPHIGMLKSWAAPEAANGEHANKDALKNMSPEEKAILEKAGKRDATRSEVAAAQYVLETHGLTTGKKNHTHGDNNNDATNDLDGIKGKETKGRLKELGIPVEEAAPQAHQRQRPPVQHHNRM